MPPPDPRKPPCDGSDDADDCPPSHGQGRLVLPLVVTASLLVFLAIVFLSIYCLVRRRRRRRQQSLLAAEAAATANPGGVQGGAAEVPDDVEGGGIPDGGGDDDVVVHHAWHIRTVGLDEAAIESIALTRYRAGAGMLGAADCSVCLGEFHDGELLRLLPKCGHAFHVPCIGTWLRAHVNCPLCRADVVPYLAAAGDSDTSAGAIADTVLEQASINTEIFLEHEQPGQQLNEQQELLVQIDQPDQPSSPEPQRRQPGSRVQNFRRVASMDSSMVTAGEAPEDEQSSKENQGNSDTACCKVSSDSGRLHHMKRSLSGGGRWSVVSLPRHCRTRSSMLPS